MHDPHNAERASQRGSSDDVVFIPRAAVVPGEYLVTGGCSGAVGRVGGCSGWHWGGEEGGGVTMLNAGPSAAHGSRPLPPSPLALPQWWGPARRLPTD